MSRFDCLVAAGLLERRAAGLGEADRLRLEEHLGTCTACHREARLLAGLVALTAPSAAVLGERGRQRAVDQAIRDGLEERERGRAAGPLAPQSVVGLRLGLSLVAAAVVCATLTLLVLRMVGPRATERRAEEAPPAAVETPVPAEASRAPLETALAEGAGLRLGRADLAAQTASHVRWDEARETVELVDGRVRFEVEPAAAGAFRVRTSRFVVEVVGTIFEVDAERVRVVRGHVRVRAADDDRLFAELDAGSEWSLAGGLAASPGSPASAAASAPPAAPDVGALLARARSELARGDTAAARR
ncbi:MAG: FecR domain-containing protein, partial [Myxococcales bacterium]|nr:FecR domain-containing protein [Myxococcales bacterium]